MTDNGIKSLLALISLILLLLCVCSCAVLFGIHGALIGAVGLAIGFVGLAMLGDAMERVQGRAPRKAMRHGQ
jgi:hypothetical protein